MSFNLAIHHIEDFSFSFESAPSDDEKDEEHLGMIFYQYVYV